MISSDVRPSSVARKAFEMRIRDGEGAAGAASRVRAVRVESTREGAATGTGRAVAQAPRPFCRGAGGCLRHPVASNQLDGMPGEG